MKRFFILPLVLVFFTVILHADQSLKSPGIALEDTDGNFTTLSSILAESNAVISFWSYDCVPCRKEMPELQKLAEKDLLKNKNVKIIFVYVEAATEKTDKKTSDRTSIDKAKEVLGALGIKEKCLMDIYGVAYKNYSGAVKLKQSAMPLLFLVKKNREIVFSAVGYSEVSLKKLEDAIINKIR